MKLPALSRPTAAADTSLCNRPRPGSVRVDTGSGGMELHGVQGSLEAKAGSGTIQAEGSPTGAWSVHTGSGEVKLKLPSDAAFDLDAHTSSGSISIDQPHSVQGSIGRKEVRGRVGGGGVPGGSGNRIGRYSDPVAVVSLQSSVVRRRLRIQPIRKALS